MKIRDTQDLKWYVLGVILSTLLLKIYLAPTDYFGILTLGIGIACLVGILIWSYMTLPDPNIYWDEKRGIIAIFRFWTVEVTSARLLSSVPIGIDLSHSGRKVLQSMYSRFMNESGGEIVFFITRPLDNESTKIGFLIRRRGLRLWNGFTDIEKLSKNLVTDTAILEHAMRAAYPHLPVEDASYQDIIRATAGGLETYALI